MGIKLEDLTGKRYGRLRVIKYSHKKNGKNYWECLCDCGAVTIGRHDAVKYGVKKSCGCYMIEKSIETGKKTKHGKAKSPEYKSWVNMKSRCYNSNVKAYNNYGGRGIKVCDEWKDSFINFYNDMGEKPFKKAQIDRIDNNSGYEPMNCTWSSSKKNNNNRRDTILIKVKDKKMTLSEISQKYKIQTATLRWRYHQGWPVSAIISRKPMSGITYDGFTSKGKVKGYEYKF